MKSHRPLDLEKEANNERELCLALTHLESADEAQAFLRDLCTPAEIQAMADRWSAARLLSQGLPYRDVHAKTGVSITTIARVARFLNVGHGGYGLVLQRLARSRSSWRSGISPSPALPTSPTLSRGVGRRRRHDG